MTHRIFNFRNSCLPFLFAVVFSLMFPLSVLAQTVPPVEEEGVVHWAYGAFLGSGWYNVSGDRKAFILRIPPRWTYRQASIDEMGKRHTGIELRLPLTLGFNQVDNLDGIRVHVLGHVARDGG